jgi:hypothetical protein
MMSVIVLLMFIGVTRLAGTGRCFHLQSRWVGIAHQEGKYSQEKVGGAHPTMGGYHQ